MEVEAVVRLALPDMMNAFMRISSLRNNALLCLEALANRKRMGGGSEDADHDLIVLRLFELSIELLESPDSFLKLPEQITPDTLPPDFESLYTSQKIAARYLNALATMHLERIVEKAEAGRVDAERCGRVRVRRVDFYVGHLGHLRSISSGGHFFLESVGWARWFSVPPILCDPFNHRGHQP